MLPACDAAHADAASHTNPDVPCHALPCRHLMPSHGPASPTSHRHPIPPRTDCSPPAMPGHTEPAPPPPTCQTLPSLSTSTARCHPGPASHHSRRRAAHQSCHSSTCRQPRPSLASPDRADRPPQTVPSPSTSHGIPLLAMPGRADVPGQTLPSRSDRPSPTPFRPIRHAAPPPATRLDDYPPRPVLYTPPMSQPAQPARIDTPHLVNPGTDHDDAPRRTAFGPTLRARPAPSRLAKPRPPTAMPGLGDGPAHGHAFG